MKIHYLHIIIIAVFLSSCSTSSVLVSIQKPADISLPQDIKTVVVANRSIPTKKNLAGNILEGLVSGEGIGTDKWVLNIVLKVWYLFWIIQIDSKPKILEI